MNWAYLCDCGYGNRDGTGHHTPSCCGANLHELAPFWWKRIEGTHRPMLCGRVDCPWCQEILEFYSVEELTK